MAEDPAGRARRIVDEGFYMTLATADADGVPWASPVWYAPESPRSLLWISDPGARHSRNIEARPQIGIVIFDSRQAPGTGKGVYFEATAERVAEAELEAAVAVFSERSLQRGDSGLELARVQAPAPSRMYRATALRIYFGEHDERTEVSLG